jgi:hypothetical protein
MNRSPSRFRPCLEALEERDLLSVSVSFESGPRGTLGLFLDASQNTDHDVISIFNDGNGHITGNAGGVEFNAGAGFSNVGLIQIVGGLAGLEVFYFQQGDASNPSGDQVFGPGLYVSILFRTSTPGSRANSFSASLNGHELTAGTLSFDVSGTGGYDNIVINATNFDIAAGTLFSTRVSDGSLPGGNTYFVMNWSGVKRGAFKVLADAGADSSAAFGLTADFLGASPLRAVSGRAIASGAAPGDLAFYGGSGDNDLAMLLHSPGGLSLTGDIYGGPRVPGQDTRNFCRRTANVKVHGTFLQNLPAP